MTICKSCSGTIYGPVINDEPESYCEGCWLKDNETDASGLGDVELFELIGKAETLSHANPTSKGLAGYLMDLNAELFERSDAFEGEDWDDGE